MNITRLRRRREKMTDLKIPIENAFLMVTDIESRDGTIGFNVKVSAHVLRNIGGTRVSIYVHDKRSQDRIQNPC
jgi:thermostable 8-oxoguanine DNA glycosylase